MDQKGRSLPSELFSVPGVFGEQLAACDWAGTELGSPAKWTEGLRIALGICLASRFPIVIFWGSDLALIYNSAYLPILGDKHPASLGRPAREVWSEIWDPIGSMLHGVLDTGLATWSEDQLFLINRSGYLEEGYFTFTYGPIREPSGTVGGVFCAVHETTASVLAGRRLRMLGELAERAGSARTAEEAAVLAAAVIETNVRDVPVAAIYFLDGPANEFRLVADAGLESVAPRVFEVGDADPPWPVALVLDQHAPSVLDQLPSGMVSLEPSSCERAVLVPIGSGEGGTIGALVAGASPHRALNADYLGFFSLLTDGINSAIVTATAYDQERRRAEELAELDRAKTEFFSNISHEFRTPLTLMVGPLDDLLKSDDPVLSPLQREQAQTAARNAERLLKLVNTLLDFSRLEAGRADAAYEPVDLSRLTADLASLFRSAIEAAGLQLDIDCPPLAGETFVDCSMWEKIVLNLLSNALKFTFAGTIAVSLTRAGDRVRLTVSDTGTGIPAEELPYVFQRFHQVRGTAGRSQEGSGIGLSLVRDLVALHGGEVSVQSTEGVGSSFVVSIPFGRDHLPADRVHPPSPRAESRGRAAAYVADAFQGTGLPDAEAGPSAASDGSGARILVADDNADMRAYLTRLLRPHWLVSAAADGATALSAARTDPPDLVLTDVMMPNLDGFELLEALRQDPATAHVPVVMLSARAGEEAAVHGLDAGADDYLVKPFTANELIARVRTQLELAHSRAEAADARQRAEYDRQARRLVDRFETLAETTTDLVGFCDPNGGITYLNRAGRAMIGIDGSEDVTGVQLADYLDPDAAEDFHAGPLADALHYGVWRGETDFRHRDGHLIPTSQVIVVHRNELGDVELVATIARDITDERRVSERLRHLADQDPLTDLMNRRLLLDELHHEIAAVRRYGGSSALLMIDLDDFKYVNDSLGHAAGDRILIEVANQLSRRLRGSDRLARLGGDEFGVILPRTDQKTAEYVAATLVSAIKETSDKTSTSGRRLSASVGIAMIAAEAGLATGDQLLMRADTAMYDAKEAGRGGVATFDPSGAHQTSMHRRLDVADQIRDALVQGAFVLHAQQIETLTGKGPPRYELLVRMRGRDGNLIVPADFLEPAERFGLVQSIDRWVVVQAIQLMARAQSAGAEVMLSVNLSGHSLLQEELSDWVAAQLEQANLTGQGLTFEVTETVAVINFAQANTLARRLNDLGCEIALDDFGAGYCSFHYLKNLTFDYIKIDGEFIQDLAHSPTNKLIVRAAVQIAKGLGKKTVAEHVDSAETLELLRSYGVDYAQGFHIGRPVPVTSFSQLRM